MYLLNVINVNFTLLACIFDIDGAKNNQGIVSFQDLNFDPVTGCEVKLGEGTIVNFVGDTYFARSYEGDSVLTNVGGTYNEDPSEFVPEGYTITEKDGVWNVKKQ